MRGQGEASEGTGEASEGTGDEVASEGLGRKLVRGLGGG